MKTLKIGADHFPPYQYMDENGDPSGSDLNFIKNVVNEMGYTPEFVLGNWDEIENLFKTKKLDILFQIQKTEEREKEFYFSRQLREAKTNLITSNSYLLEISSKDLISKKNIIGVIRNFQYGEFIDDIDEALKRNYTATEDIISATINDKVDFGVVDHGVFNHLTKHMDTKLFTVPKIGFNRPLYVVFHDDDLRAHFDQYL